MTRLIRDDSGEREGVWQGERFTAVPAKTGWCHHCGRVTVGVFCRLRCRRGWEITQRVEERRVVRRGKREGYGLAGSTH